MGLFQFLLIAVVVVLACAAAIWLLNNLAPGHPPIVDTLIWVLAVVILILILAQATGLLSHDVPIPHLR